ncbi:hypothetical protein H112_02483 [Trichophyton rubrum D6]|uniref:Uncharacterized protein n=1 Tax=Trichophyton rubrum CBS 288.86 TaxID=1215330 RepID=A0A022W930_TRIRU|nr:hypothetical protein H100_02484 [Trichophyton rubrum MR850]EZF44167.1 hypothetical protein H102_02478 [Trichophyton rubrum CBS 100081]EZF54819.1 hypothetical protein H103_02491 [Trichophyton rubrum CBS 288.86]EZF65428.1 hypothetical protein H104_02469 [Trichophyton rubrum CBS 289.86]EZF86727.1 hypothetical protein H110_02488 [Trichophyton rubrum MR1448]EZF97512.1 hypothetical protein H113_02497 [Trichophyton rubrum MR1459]EZG19043.1 hypothetical protein H107_02564 [Trichophyton rubrum CBS 
MSHGAIEPWGEDPWSRNPGDVPSCLEVYLLTSGGIRTHTYRHGQQHERKAKSGTVKKEKKQKKKKRSKTCLSLAGLAVRLDRIRLKPHRRSLGDLRDEERSKQEAEISPPESRTRRTRRTP